MIVNTSRSFAQFAASLLPVEVQSADHTFFSSSGWGFGLRLVEDGAVIRLPFGRLPAGTAPEFFLEADLQRNWPFVFRCRYSLDAPYDTRKREITININVETIEP